MQRGLFVLLLIFILPGLQLFAQTNRGDGKLFIIGGGSRSESLINEMIRTSALEANDHIIVLPMASAEPDTSFKYIAQEIARAAGNAIGNINFNVSNSNDPALLDSLRTAKLIYITGGDQNRFMKSVLNTPVYQAIHDAFRSGSTIAGTSAGAAVMSKRMITGQQSLGDTAYRETFPKIWADNIVFQEGLGLLETAIIDQHFIKRSRFNRLISALNENPDVNCFGIDEGTALVVEGKKGRVAGVSQVIQMSKPKGLKKTAEGLIGLKDMRFSIYVEGDEFRVK